MPSKGANTIGNCNRNAAFIQALIWDEVFVYNPQRVLRQLEMIKDMFKAFVTCLTPGLVVENKFRGEVRMEILVGVEMLFYRGWALKGYASRRNMGEVHKGVGLVHGSQRKIFSRLVIAAPTKPVALPINQKNDSPKPRGR